MIKGRKQLFLEEPRSIRFIQGTVRGRLTNRDAEIYWKNARKRGICAEPGLKEYYREQISKEETTKEDEFDWADIGKAVNSGIMYEIFGKYHAPTEEYEIPEERMEAARQFSDTAVFVLGRNSGGEECDRHLQGDYYLTDSEKFWQGRYAEILKR